MVESVLQTLIEWAAAALEKSSNQPILPHVIIVLNASPPDIDPTKWVVVEITSRIVIQCAA